jgi:hypothetical protein
MPTFLFRCPNTGLRVQGYTADQTSPDNDEFVPVQCHACSQVHLVNPASGKALGDDKE